MSAEHIRERYPQWEISDDEVGLFQAAGGLLDIRKSVSAHTSLALARGVEFRAHTPVTGVRIEPNSVAVTTAGGARRVASRGRLHGLRHRDDERG